MLMQDELELIVGRLRDVARDGGTIEAAQVKLIGLDEIRAAAGARWPHMRERVRSGSFEILTRHTGPDDVIVPAGDGFLIILAQGAPGQYQRRCQELREALLSFYLGEEGMAALRPEVKTRILTSDGLTDLLASSVRKDHPLAEVQPRALGTDIAHVRLYLASEQQVAARMTTPVVHQRGGLRMAYNPEFILDGRHHVRQDFLELDIAVLDEALAAACAARDAGKTSAFGVSVHASTLQQRRLREDYLAWWRRTPPELKRTMFISVAEIEKGTPLLSIAEWSAALRPHVNRVALTFHCSDHAISSISAAGAWAAGFHLPIYSGAQEGQRAERTLEQVRFWAKALHGQGMKLTINGFQNPDFLARAVALGADYATSDLLWPFAFVDTPTAAAIAPAKEETAHAAA